MRADFAFKLHRLMPRLWWAALALFAAVASGLASLAIISDRQATIRTAENRVQSLGRILLDHAERAIEDGEKLILAVTPSVQAWDQKDAAVGREIYDELRSYIVGSPQIAAAWVIDAAGNSLIDTWSFPGTVLDARGRHYFQLHVAGAPDPVLAGTETGSISKKQRFTLSRAVRSSDGSLVAVVAVAIYSSYFEALYREAISWPEGAAGLFVAHEAHVDALARVGVESSPSDTLIRDLASLSAKEQRGIAVLPLPEGQRIAAWQASDRHAGLFATTSQSVAAALAGWRLRALLTGGAVTLAVALFGLLAVLGARADRARRQIERQRMLLTEVHHRVKNNLGIVAAMITMGARQVPAGSEAEIQLTKIGGQVMAVAALYDLMQNMPGEGGVDLQELLDRICAAVGKTAGVEVVHKRGERIVIGNETAVSVVIIVNELITNAIKHGRGDVEVSCAAEAARIAVSIANPGDLPEGFDPMSEYGFGLKMAAHLALSLGGEVKVVSYRPARISLVFPTKPEVAVA